MLAAALLAASISQAARVRLVDELTPALHKAIQSGDAIQMRRLLEEGANPNGRDSQGTPALMNAVLYAGTIHMRLLLEHGADPNARNPMDATALVWAAGDAAKASLLVERGAAVNVQSKLGRTPLMVAASVAGNAATVKLLLAKGAAVNLRDNIAPIPVVPAGGGKGTALIDAARTGDEASVRMLLEAGADVNAADARNGTALSEAIVYSRRDLVKLLLAAGASAEGRVTALAMPYLALAAMRGDVEIARMLVNAKAPVDAPDVSGATPLLWATASDHDDPAMVEFLLSAGAQVNARTKSGDSALDWALRRGETSVVRALRAAGAESSTLIPIPAPAVMAPVPAAEAIRRAMAPLAKSAPVAFKKGGCASCHNHTQPLTAFAEAARKGVAVDAAAVEGMIKMTTGMLMPMVPALLEGSDVPPDIAITGGYFLEALRAQGYPAGQMTAALVHKMAQSQMADGHWVGWAPRPPIESGDIQATAMTIRALRCYPLPGRRGEMDARLARGRQWLLAAKPRTTEEYIMRLEGLAWSGASAAAVREAARQLAALQRGDGGWGQLPSLHSDAYATAKALIALHGTPGIGDHSAAVRFLRTTQHADGTWHVKTRAIPLQPLKDVEFPHGRDQWVSASATSLAVQALALQLK